MRKYNKSPSKIKSFVFLGQQTTDNSQQTLSTISIFAMSRELWAKMLVARSS